MPEIGEIRRAKELGYKTENKYVWTACVDCGKERWQATSARYHRCRICANKYRGVFAKSRLGENHPMWKGGRRPTKQGYVRVYLSPDSFFAAMCSGNTVLEHRLVMAEHLKRCLLPWEVVHHKNGIKTDNRLANLELLPISKSHLVSTAMARELQYLRKRVTILESELALLKAQLEAERCLRSSTDV